MARFVIDPGFFDEVRRSEPVVEMLQEIGPEIVSAAKANAAESSETGAFAESIQGEIQYSPRVHMPYFRVWSDDPGALSIEFGNSHQQPHRALGRAIGSV